MHVFGSYPDRRVAFEPLRAWVNGVISNIEYELEIIERLRIMFISVSATLISLVAAAVAAGSTLIEISNWFRFRY